MIYITANVFHIKFNYLVNFFKLTLVECAQSIDNLFNLFMVRWVFD